MQKIKLSRRHFILSGMGGLAATALTPSSVLASSVLASSREKAFQLRAALTQAPLLGSPHGSTAVWAYNGQVPGPEIRVRQGDRVSIRVENALSEETTVHWHGYRVPHAMDGVPHLTQTPISSGEAFTYEFNAEDAGTFWYHPHQNSQEQVGRGLYGPLIVEEAQPLPVDRDITWMLDDWRLTSDGSISDNFGHPHDAMHNGRVGNTVTINGQVPDTFLVHSGERIRLRLINSANARIFELDFGKLDVNVIALDGQPVTPHTPQDQRVMIGPAMRVDLVLDITGQAGTKFSIMDRFYKDLEYRLIDILHSDQALRDQVPDWPLTLPANPLSEPDLTHAVRQQIIFNGGMMGQMLMQEMGGNMSGGMMENMSGGMIGRQHSDGVWFINGQAASGHILEPLLTLNLGQTYLIEMTNATAWHHPIHLHGHSFRVVSRNGQTTQYLEWQDTVLMAPREKVEIAFVADNPGDWMFHCHIFEHQAAGMMGVIRVV